MFSKVFFNFNSFVFKLSGLLKHYGPSHVDYHSTNMALVKMQSVIRKMSVKLRESVSQHFFEYFWEGYLGQLENLRGSSIFVFYFIFMTKFFEVFWGGTWGAPLLPLSPRVHLCRWVSTFWTIFVLKGKRESAIFNCLCNESLVFWMLLYY